MDIPKIDSRDRHDILEQMRALAAAYVPEWRWDDREPDVGVILARLFADMMENTVSKYNRSMYNHYLAFLNLLGARLMPPSPAEGMVTVEVVPGSQGVYIDRGAAVYAAAGTGTGRVFYETAEALEALDTRVDRIFFTSAARDSIVCAYDGSRGEGDVRLFSFDACRELQRHLLTFRDDAVFFTKDRTDVCLKLTHSRSQRHREELPGFFADPQAVTWEYFDGTDWRAVDRVTGTADGVRLEAEGGSRPVVSGEGRAMGLIRCRIRRIPAGGLFLTDISWTGQGVGILPDAMSSSDHELSGRDFAPFGDVLSVYSDFNISSREVFVKAGAAVDIDFEMEFFKTPVETVETGDRAVYRSFMTDDDFPCDEGRDVRIERVLWEYWNGMGWARLFPGGENEDFFTPSGGGRTRRRLSFRCPPDMAEVVLGAASGPFIRARIDKLSHMYSTAGSYAAPLVRRIALNYRYEPEDAVICRSVRVESNLEAAVRQLPDSGERPLMTAGLCADPAMYLCLSGPLTGGPVRLFFDIRDGICPDAPALRWEYFGRTADGTPGWKNMEVMDLTDDLTHSAIVTLVGKRDFVRAGFFGAEGYYIRLVDPTGQYDVRDWRKNPVIRQILPNTVPVIQRERRPAEYFYMERGLRNKRCELSLRNVYSVDVRVNEAGTLSVKEEERFLQSPGTDVTRNAEGAVTGLWIPWREVDRLEAAGPEDRVFTVDYAEGAVIFGDGRHGRIPADGNEETIRIDYVICDGSFGNVEAGAILGFAAKPIGVAGVTNRRPLGGGVERETIDQAARRASGELLGMGRIVTLDDFRRAVLASNRSIRRVKCVPHVDRMGRPAQGRLSVAVLPEEYRQGAELFSAVTGAAREAIAEKASMLLTGGTQVDVFEVRYVEICVSVEAVISDYDLYHEVYKALEARLAEFLDPITGGFSGQGWEIGQIPGRELVYNSVKTVKHIKWIRSLQLFAYMITETGRQAVETADARRDSFAVPVFGEPEIRLVVERAGKKDPDIRAGPGPGRE